MKKTILFLLILIAFNCGAPEKVYPVKGAVYQIKPDSMMIVIAHDTIPDLMYPMVMPFDLKDLKEIEGLSIGDSVHFEFVWGDTSTWARKFKVVGQGKLPEDEQDDFFEDEEYATREIGEILDDVSLLNLDSSKVRLSDSDGRYRFISFIFTRCPMPNMCPAVVVKNQYLADTFAETDEIEFIMISFDYIFDTPSVMKSIYGSHTNLYPNMKFYSSFGHLNDIFMLAGQSFVSFWGIDENDIGHTLRSVIIDPERRLMKTYDGTDWPPEAAERDIRNLLQAYH